MCEVSTVAVRNESVRQRRGNLPVYNGPCLWSCNLADNTAYSNWARLISVITVTSRPGVCPASPAGSPSSVAASVPPSPSFLIGLLYSCLYRHRGTRYNKLVSNHILIWFSFLFFFLKRVRNAECLLFFVIKKKLFGIPKNYWTYPIYTSYFLRK